MSFLEIDAVAEVGAGPFVGPLPDEVAAAVFGREVITDLDEFFGSVAVDVTDVDVGEPAVGPAAVQRPYLRLGGVVASEPGPALGTDFTGAGIVVRNSIILVDFIELRLKEGIPLDEAVIDAGAIRFRPMMLTAAAVIVGAAFILADPIFQGLAISLMAGEVASLFLSRMTVPLLYYRSKCKEIR